MNDDILDFNYGEDNEKRQLEYASFWTRVGASLLDTLILLPVGLYLFLQPDFPRITTFMEYSFALDAGPQKLVSQVANLLFLVSCLFVAFRDNRQALHDSMAGTYVVMK